VLQPLLLLLLQRRRKRLSFLLLLLLQWLFYRLCTLLPHPQTAKPLCNVHAAPGALLALLWTDL
jgi:hypothetical protein